MKKFLIIAGLFLIPTLVLAAKTDQKAPSKQEEQASITYELIDISMCQAAYVHIAKAAELVNALGAITGSYSDEQGKLLKLYDKSKNVWLALEKYQVEIVDRLAANDTTKRERMLEVLTGAHNKTLEMYATNYLSGPMDLYLESLFTSDRECFEKYKHVFRSY
jgi:hypothetical protein